MSESQNTPIPQDNVGIPVHLIADSMKQITENLDYNIRHLEAIAHLMKIAANHEDPGVLDRDKDQPNHLHQVIFDVLGDALETELGCLSDNLGDLSRAPERRLSRLEKSVE